MLKIIPISALTDNYIWAVCNESTKKVAIVDPGDGELRVLQPVDHRTLCLAV